MQIIKNNKINLSSEPQIIISEPAILVYLEKTGQFMKNAPLAWRELHEITEDVFDKSQITGMLGLSRIDNSKKGDESFIYQAGITFKSKPAKIPDGLKTRELQKTKYACFLLTGSYLQLAEAYPQAFAILNELKLKLQTTDFCIERYLNTPQNTPEDQLKTEILIPIV